MWAHILHAPSASGSRGRRFHPLRNRRRIMTHRCATTVLVCWLALYGAPALASDDHGDTCATATAIPTDGTAVIARAPSIVSMTKQASGGLYARLPSRKVEATRTLY